MFSLARYVRRLTKPGLSRAPATSVHGSVVWRGDVVTQDVYHIGPGGRGDPCAVGLVVGRRDGRH